MSKILIIGDIPRKVQLMKTVATNLGHHVLAAGDAETGFDLAREEQPDMIFVGIELAKADEFRLCHRLQQDPATGRIPTKFMPTLVNELTAMVGKCLTLVA